MSGASDFAGGQTHADLVGELFNRLRQPLKAYLRRLLRNDADAEDIVQETCVRLLGSLDCERDEESMRGYAYRVATNLAFDRMRRLRTRGIERPLETVELASADPSLDHTIDLERDIELLKQAIVDMNARCRDVFILRTREQLSYDEIASRLGMGKRTVERAMREALEHCQKRLKP